MGTPIWLELIKMIPSVLTAFAALVGLVIAYRGLWKWRSETIGKRKTELAEEVLADFYEARDVIQAARSPLAYGDEGSSRKRGESETEHEARQKNAFYAVAERLQKREEFLLNYKLVGIALWPFLARKRLNRMRKCAVCTTKLWLPCGC